MCPRPSGRSVSAQVLACASPSVEMRDPEMAWRVGRMCHVTSTVPIVRSLVPLRSCLFIDRASFHCTVPNGIMAKKQKNESGVRVCLPFFHFFTRFPCGGHFVIRQHFSFFSARLFC